MDSPLMLLNKHGRPFDHVAVVNRGFYILLPLWLRHPLGSLVDSVAVHADWNLSATGEPHATAVRINAVYNIRKFRDGLGSGMLTGPIPSDTRLTALAYRNGKLDGGGGSHRERQPRVASHGPSLNSIETSCAGCKWRPFNGKLLSCRRSPSTLAVRQTDAEQSEAMR